MSKFTVTIARQYGSDGTEIGKMLSEKLGCDFYDRKLIEMAAKESGFDPAVLENIDEKATSSLLYSLSYGHSLANDGLSRINLPLNDKLYAIQSTIIRNIADGEKSAVIVGRCADYVLADHPDAVRIYIFSDFDRRVERVAGRRGLSISKAKDEVIRVDKKRAGYYNYYTGRKWGRIENYDLVINVDKTGKDGAVDVILAYLNSAV
ncbi:MAG: cytidylate kinase-like family protein [Clostridia bacterium]|nr:cytidylate kinase-like family protein [Clostridia bacterium]